MDISESILATKVTLSRPIKRHIGSNSKQGTIYRYKNYVHKQFIIHQIYERAKELYKQSTEGKVTPEIKQRLNTLDKQITEIMLAAEKSQCPRQQ
jgi:hypothetical protein